MPAYRLCACGLKNTTTATTTTTNNNNNNDTLCFVEKPLLWTLFDESHYQFIAMTQFYF